MNTTIGISAAGSVAARFTRRLVCTLVLACLAPGVLAQTTPALSVVNESPNGYNCDVYRWTDSAGKQRTAALSRNNAADPGGSRGGVLYQYRFFPGGGATERVITGTGAHSYNGFGYVVNHHDDTAFVSTGTTGTYTKVFTGRHHAIHQFKLTYPINGVAVAATIHWYFATGQDDPVYAITFDTSAAGSGGMASSIDSRAPYGDLQFGGDGLNPQVAGVAWGDKYKFTTTSAPLTPQSTWDYSQPNTVPYTQMWIANPDAEMGAVQTLSWLQHNTGGSWFTNNWGHTSANRVDGGSDFGAWLMPTNWQWPYQLNQYELMDNTSPTTSKRCAWGLMYGAVGKTSYDGYGYEAKFSGHPYQSYSVATVIGLHSASAVQARVTRTERILAATLTATTGTLVSSGPGGVGRTDNVVYSKTGYNALYGAYELTAAAGAFGITLNSAGAIRNPTFIVRGMGGLPAQISLDGTTLVADQGYFASYDAATQSLWLTVNTNWTGSHTLASGAGVPPAVAVTVAPATATVGAGSSTTLTATVTHAANTAVTWSVVEASGGSVSTSGVYTAPTVLGTYNVRATSVADASKSAQATITVANLAPAYTYIYQSGLKGGWSDASWGATVNFSAGTQGHSGTATAEVSIPNAWQGLALGDISNWQTETYHYLSDVDTIEFDIYPHSDSVGFENLQFILDDNVDGTDADNPAIVDLIPGWAAMTNAQRYNNWHHVVVDLSTLNAEFDRFLTIVFFKMSASGTPHFRLADIKMGRVPDVTAPVVTLGTPVVSGTQLSLPFTTNEAATYRIEYGYGNYSQTLTGPADTWATSHGPLLTGLTTGATLQYRIVATDHAGNAGLLSGTIAIVDPPPPTVATVTITVDPTNTHPISPWIYGGNFYPSWAARSRNLTINRSGGNRLTAYNWENNASNAGSDWGPYSNDSYLGGGDTPGEAIRTFVADNRTRGIASIFTVQMQGYVSADKNGLVTLNFPTHLAQRFKQVVFKKPGGPGTFTLTPSTTDASVYMDEFVWAMNQKIPGLYTDPVNPAFLLLDNEPELWPSTHAEIQQAPISVADYLAKTIALATAIKDVAPAVKIFGPVHYGFNGILNWQNTSSHTFTSSYWFTDKYLDDLKAASTTAGRRLVDVYNFHWYSEARGSGTRIINLTGTTLTEAQIQAIVQSPRSLWDPTYTEDSWVAQNLGGPVRIVARLKEKIAARWPGTGLAITEWANGGNNHIAGAIAVADNLGIFGQQDLFMASMWPDGELANHSFDLAGFKMYRDFDGALGTFGDICLPTVSSNTALVSAYVSRDSVVPGRHVIVAINRSNAPQAVRFNGLALAGTARQYRMTGASTTPASVGNATVDLATWITPLPAYSITTIEITAAAPAANYAAWRTANFSGAALANDAVSAPLADPDQAGVTNLQRYAFALPARGPVANPITLGSATVGTDRFLTLTFPRRAAATDLTYILESSTDLVTWTAVPGSTYTAGAGPITAQDSVPIGGAPRRFLRLRLTQQ